MSRIRTIKPDFWTSAQVIECSTNARLLFIGLWNFCDDAGRHSWSPRQIRAQVFPGDDFTTDDVLRMLDELSTNDLIRRYVVDGKEYLYVTGWHHQKIDRPQKPTCPAPFDEHSTNGIDGEEGKGKEKKERNKPPSQASGGIALKVVHPPEEPEPQPEAEAPPEDEIPAMLDRRRYPEDFEAVWLEYLPIAAKNATKADAARAFARLSAADKRDCWTGTVRYVQWVLEERRRRPDTPVKHLSTFINRRGWERFLESEEVAHAS